jgi:hypothetical protein
VRGQQQFEPLVHKMLYKRFVLVVHIGLVEHKMFGLCKPFSGIAHIPLAPLLQRFLFGIQRRPNKANLQLRFYNSCESPYFKKGGQKPPLFIC